MSFYMFERKINEKVETSEIKWYSYDPDSEDLEWEWEDWVTDKGWRSARGTAYKLEVLTIAQRKELISRYKNQIEYANSMLLSVEEYPVEEENE